MMAEESRCRMNTELTELDDAALATASFARNIGPVWILAVTFETGRH